MAGNEGEQVIITNNAAAPRPKGIISAISEIQQFYVIEKTGQEIPAEFLTIEGSLDFMKIGLKSGFSEGLFLFIFMPLIEFYLVPFVMQSPTPFVEVLFHMMPYFTVILSTIMCSYISKYYIGCITRRAVNSLFMGRSTSLLVKAFLIFILYTFIDRLGTPKNIWFLAEKLGGNAQKFYYGFYEIQPYLMPAATRAAVALAVAATLPFMSVYFLDRWRSYKVARNMRYIKGK